jgi:hypothetical protein
VVCGVTSGTRDATRTSSLARIRTTPIYNAASILEECVTFSQIRVLGTSCINEVINPLLISIILFYFGYPKKDT